MPIYFIEDKELRKYVRSNLRKTCVRVAAQVFRRDEFTVKRKLCSSVFYKILDKQVPHRLTENFVLEAGMSFFRYLIFLYKLHTFINRVYSNE